MTIQQILEKARPEITRRFNQLERCSEMILNLDGIEVEKDKWINGWAEIYITVTDLSYDKDTDYLAQKITGEVVVEISTSDDNEKPFLNGQPLNLLKNAIMIHIETLIKT